MYVLNHLMSLFRISTCILCLWLVIATTRANPPLITNQPAETLVYIQPTENSTGNPFRLECEASGSDPVRYWWLKDGRPFNWFQTRNRIVQPSNQGSLIFLNPLPRDQGFYQCFAANDAGVAITKVVQVRYAHLGEFPSDDRPFALIVSELDELSLPCHAAPEGNPPPTYGWILENATGGGEPIAVEDDNRIAVDHRGRLHFASVEARDAKRQSFYACNASNLAGSRLGSRIVLTVLPLDAKFKEGAARPLSSHFISPEQLEAPLGKSFQLYCIYGGTPVPEVTWKKIGGPNRYLRSREFIARGHVLRIPAITWQDEGVYQCNVSNGIGEFRTHTFVVNVVVAPKFLTFRVENVNSTFGDDVRLSCPVFGIPTPEIEWLINGTSLRDHPLRHHYTTNYTEMSIDRVTFSDGGTYQCNASNSYGYDVINLYLQVSALPPPSAKELRIPMTYEMVAGQSQRIDCRITIPEVEQVRWFRGSQALNAENVEILPNGTLWIHNASESNRGEYHCRGKSKAMKAEMRLDAANLVVMQKTEFILTPQDTSTCVGCNVVLDCQVNSDPSLNVTIHWLHNGDPVIGLLNRQLFTHANNSLSISRVDSKHAGTYSCVARTELDFITESAILFVKDVPPSPEIVGVKCSLHEGQIEWKALSDLRNPVTVFEIQFVSDVGIQDGWGPMENVSAPLTVTKLRLVPGRQYRFRIVAFNEVGASRPSEASRICETEPDTPYKHPNGVSGRTGNIPREMVISWKTVLPIDHNGPGFFYRVYWRPAEENAMWNALDVTDWQQTNVGVAIPATDTFHRYIIKVESRNAVGKAPIQAREVEAIGGEEAPLVAPSQLSVLKILNSTTAVVYWKPVSADSIRGIFKGYKLETWTSDEGYRNRRVIVVPGNHTVVILKVLQPSAQNNLRVWAFNGGFDGPPSSTLSLDTLLLSQQSS